MNGLRRKFRPGMHLLSLEPRLLMARAAVAQLPLPTAAGSEFVIDNWDNDVNSTQFLANDFAANNGTLGTTALSLSAESNSPIGNSLRLTRGGGTFGGYFTYLFGPSHAGGSAVTGRFLDSQDIYRGFGGLENRSIEQIKFDVKHALSAPLVIKLELKDEAGRIVSATRSTPATGSGWSTVTLNLPGDFSGAAGFDWRQIDHVVFVVEDSLNAPNWTFLLDNVRLVDVDGAYPDFAAMTNPGDGSLLPQYTDGFLDHIRRLTSLYFIDAASPFAATGGMIQDTSRSTALTTIGGVGFQLNSYIIDAEHGYLPRASAAQRVVNLLRFLWNAPQNSGTSNVAGYEGFFYHFFDITGRRDGTNELSPIDTALAIAGVVTAGQYFTGQDALETEIRTLAHNIYARVNWRFMLNPSGPEANQFFLAWKPETNVSDYQYFVPGRPGRFTGTSTNPLTIDYYTDEGMLLALLAMGAPNPAFRVGRAGWDAIFRSQNPGSNFVQSYQGALFTYQFASVWLDTDRLGSDNHPTKPIDFFENTRRAIQATRNYAIANTTNRDTWFGGAGATRWGISATAGPFGFYFADAARPAALNINQDNPLEVGTVTPYAVGSSIAHEPQLAIESLWRMARHEDLNQDGKPDLLHPRFGFVDAFTLDIADAALRGGSGGNIRPQGVTGPWANSNGYAIDNGPMLGMIDNYLSGQFIPGLFASHPGIRVALNELFPDLPPVVLATTFPFETGPNRVTFQFSENVQPSLAPADLVLTNLTTAATIDPALLAVQYDSATNTASFRYTADGGRLPDGNYRAVLPAAGVTDVGGHALESDSAIDFFVFSGDANRDRTVNIGDFSILAANFNLPGTFSLGDYNYNGTTEIGDFSILAAKFNTTLPAARPAAVATSTPAMPAAANSQFARLFSDRSVMELLEPVSGDV